MHQIKETLITQAIFVYNTFNKSNISVFCWEEHYNYPVLLINILKSHWKEKIFFQGPIFCNSLNRMMWKFFAGNYNTSHCALLKSAMPNNTLRLSLHGYRSGLSLKHKALS